MARSIARLSAALCGVLTLDIVTVADNKCHVRSRCIKNDARSRVLSKRRRHRWSPAEVRKVVHAACRDLPRIVRRKTRRFCLEEVASHGKCIIVAIDGDRRRPRV